MTMLYIACNDSAGKQASKQGNQSIYSSEARPSDDEMRLDVQQKATHRQTVPRARGGAMTLSSVRALGLDCLGRKTVMSRSSSMEIDSLHDRWMVFQL